jgi:formate dehydrogenase alpha subunit
MTSLDQRINLLTPAIVPVGSAKSDLQIFADLYQRLVPGAAAADTASVMEEMRQLSGLYGAVCFSGSNVVRGCLKAPFRPEGRTMICSTPAATAPLAAGLHLLSGKILHHFGTTSTHAEGNLAVSPAGYIEMHPVDAKACGVAAGGRVKLTTTVGSAEGPVRISDTLPQGLLFAPYHFADVNVQQLMPAGSNLVAVSVIKV